MLCPLLDSKASGGKQRKTAAALEKRACPEAATDKAKRVKFESRQIFRYDNHDFQTIGKFCEFAKPCITSTKSPGRIRLEKYRDSRSFQRVDTLWLAVNHRQLHKLYAEVWFRARSEGRTRVEAIYKIDAVYLTTPDSVNVVYVLVWFGAGYYYY